MGKRITVLMAWKEMVVRADQRAPSDDDLRLIGYTGELLPEGIGDMAAVQRWEPTIRYLLWQLKFGVNDPLSQLPEDLLLPSANGSGLDQEATNPTGTTEDPVFVALRDWWQAEQTVDSRLGKLREHHLRTIAATGSRTEEEIGPLLPGSLRDVAPRIAAVIAAATPAVNVGDGATPPATPPGPGPGHRPAAPEEAALEELELADYDYTPPRDTPRKVRRKSPPDGLPELSWDAAGVSDHHVVLYRVVSIDGHYAPDAPQFADPVTVTQQLSCVDTRPFRALLRHIQVWIHTGRDHAAAAAAEPVLHAEAVFVAQVRNAVIVEDGDSIVGEWTVPAGIATVEVLRVPIDRVIPGKHSSPEYRVAQLRPFVHGFEDYAARRGETYMYEMSVEVEYKGSRLRSDPVKVELTVSSVLAPVTDLRVVPTPEGGPTVDLHWTPPEGGKVRIHRTEEAPRGGVDVRPVDVSVLPKAKLEDATILRRRVDEVDGEASMMKVPIPSGWTMVYFTPVTVLDGMAAVGPSQHILSIPPIREARIVERTRRQVITFAWPAGADTVAVHVGGPHQDAADIVRGKPITEVSKDQYVREGGLYLRNPLPFRGCSVLLVPFTYSDGTIDRGPSCRLEYEGLRRIWYRVTVERDAERRPLRIAVQLRAEYDQPSVDPLWFVLVTRPDRLPLHERDGWSVPMQAIDRPEATAHRFRPPGVGTEWGSSWTAQAGSGYVRLFACVHPDLRPAVALIDPDVRELYTTALKARS